eukprot:GEMP01109599.1.p1 GENE.GEMP01109599.1~~GEMP01109599.1.p1  ORF type:complete len:173 (+),score=9.20 GEMP01109599.1:30-548(+)
MSTLYVNGLSQSTPINSRDLENLFRVYGTLVNSWVARSPPGYGFVTFLDKADSMLAIIDLDGRPFQGNKLRVEPQRGGGGRRRGDTGGDNTNDRREASKGDIKCGSDRYTNGDLRRRRSLTPRRSCTRSRSVSLTRKRAASRPRIDSRTEDGGKNRRRSKETLHNINNFYLE